MQILRSVNYKDIDVPMKIILHQTWLLQMKETWFYTKFLQMTMIKIFFMNKMQNSMWGFELACKHRGQNNVGSPFFQQSAISWQLCNNPVAKIFQPRMVPSCCMVYQLHSKVVMFPNGIFKICFHTSNTAERYQPPLAKLLFPLTYNESI